MKVIAQTAALQEALALASSIVALRTPKPVLQCVKLVAAGGTLTLLATDLEIGGRFVVSQVEVAKEGEALVPVAKLADIVREAGADTLTISVEKESCQITAGGARFKLLGFDPAEYPAIADFEDAGDFQVPSEAVAGLIDKTLFAAAKTHSHYAICGVLWEAAAKKLQLVATDGHRLAIAKAGLTKPATRDVSAIVPNKLMSLLQRATGGTEDTLAVKVTETQILIRSARAVLISSLVQGHFPRYSDVVPKDCVRKAIINALDFGHRIRQAALLTTEESKGVRLAFAPEQLTLTSRSPETGEAEAMMPIKFTGEPLEIAFNPAFLTDALKVSETDEITMEFTAGNNKPALMKLGQEFTYVVMPVDLR